MESTWRVCGVPVGAWEKVMGVCRVGREEVEEVGLGGEGVCTGKGVCGNG